MSLEQVAGSIEVAALVAEHGAHADPAPQLEGRLGGSTRWANDLHEEGNPDQGARWGDEGTNDRLAAEIPPPTRILFHTRSYLTPGADLANVQRGDEL
jgi:hypothetical protein